VSEAGDLEHVRATMQHAGLSATDEELLRLAASLARIRAMAEVVREVVSPEHEPKPIVLVRGDQSAES
jgi:hypothetical protein